MPAKEIHQLDLAVTEVDRSLAFYNAVLGPLGLTQDDRYPSYRGTEEVVYLRFGDQLIGLRPADGGEHRSTTRRSSIGTWRTTTPSSRWIRTASGSRSFAWDGG